MAVVEEMKKAPEMGAFSFGSRLCVRLRSDFNGSSFDHKHLTVFYGDVSGSVKIIVGNDVGSSGVGINAHIGGVTGIRVHFNFIFTGGDMLSGDVASFGEVSVYGIESGHFVEGDGVASFYFKVFTALYIHNAVSLEIVVLDDIIAVCVSGVSKISG